MAFDLDLPDWNEALKLTHESSFNCSPVKQPLAQVRQTAAAGARPNVRTGACG